MSYTPHTWSNGETITAARLNALEQAVAGAGGYDAEVYIHRESGTSVVTGTIVSGDYATLSALIADDTPPNILMRVCDDSEGVKFSTSAVAVYDFFNSQIAFYAPYFSAYGRVVGNLYFTWSSSGYINDTTIYID